MSTELFEVKPVTGYEGARYPAAFDAGVDAVTETDERHHPAVVALTLVLLAGIAVGLIGCYLRTDYVPETPGIDGGPDGGDGGDGGPPPCDEGALRCADASTLEQCTDGEWVAESCAEACLEDYGPAAYSLGCDAAAEDPCQCEQDIIGGDAPVCTPDDIMCVDDRTLGRCDEAWNYVTQDCDEYCVETYGPDYYSLGCDAAAEDPCQCEQNIIGGVEAICTPGDIICFDEATLGVCDDAIGDYTRVACADRCVEVNGPGSVSAGCDAAAADPCQCGPSPDDPGK